MISADVAGLMDIGGDVVVATRLVGALSPSSYLGKAYETN